MKKHYSLSEAAILLNVLLPRDKKAEKTEDL